MKQLKEQLLEKMNSINEMIKGTEDYAVSTYWDDKDLLGYQFALFKYYCEAEEYAKHKADEMELSCPEMPFVIMLNNNVFYSSNDMLNILCDS